MSVYVLTAVCLLVTAVNPATSQDIQHYNSTPTQDHQCPPWQDRNITGECTCGDDLENIVLCREPDDLQLYSCFCMTYNMNNNKTCVGSCQYTCQRTEYGYALYFPIHAKSSTQINEFMCRRYNRQGQLCGSCVPGYAPPVYSYYLSCVNCTTSNWGKYTAVSLLPLTAFFVFAVTFRLSATSPKLNGFILCIQILTSPPNMRALANVPQNTLSYTLTSLFGIWNLDFFRMVYTPFCLLPHTNALHVLALDYIVAVYPLLLIALSYLLVLLYDRNIRLIVCLWKPFLPLFIKFQRQWNIRNSLVEAFASFLLLSYIKILSMSVDLLVPVLLYDQHGHTLSQLYLFNQGDLPFLGSQHLPYACLALSFLLIFTLLPMLLLFLYPCSCFQTCLNRTGCSCQPLHTFMDTFQGHYKNGTNATRDLRFFSGFYLLLRVVVYASTVVTYQIASYAYTTAIIAVLALSVALAQPYKIHIYNVIDTILLTTAALLYVTYAPLTYTQPIRLEAGLTAVNSTLGSIPILYLAAVCIVWLFSSRCISQGCHKLHQKLRRDEMCVRGMKVDRENYESLLA